MRKALGLFLLPLLTVFVGGAVADPDPRLVAIDAKASYRDTDFSAYYQVVQSKPGQGEAVTLLKMMRRDRNEQFVIEIQQPEADKGRGFFRDGPVIKKYNPLEKRFDVTSGKDQLRNSNIRLSDFMGATFARDYSVTSVETASIGAQKVQLLSLKANNDSVTFPLVKIWVNDENLIVRKADFSLSGQLLRTAITKYETVGSRWVPSYFIIQDELRGQKVNNVLVKEKTAVTVTKPEFGTLDNLTFSQSYLEGKSR